MVFNHEIAGATDTEMPRIGSPAWLATPRDHPNDAILGDLGSGPQLLQTTLISKDWCEP